MKNIPTIKFFKNNNNGKHLQNKRSNAVSNLRPKKPFCAAHKGIFNQMINHLKSLQCI